MNVSPPSRASTTFEQRENCWQEPVDRVLNGQLNEFGDAEVAALIAPRPLYDRHVAGKYDSHEPAWTQNLPAPSASTRD